MALLSMIRRWGIPGTALHSEIARRTGLSRNTIRKYLPSGTVNRSSGSGAAEQAGSLRRQAVAALKTEAGESAKRRRTLKQLHADLVVLGYEVLL